MAILLLKADTFAERSINLVGNGRIHNSRLVLKVSYTGAVDEKRPHSLVREPRGDR